MSRNNKYERKKPFVNVGTIGHVDLGKLTLTAALEREVINKDKDTSYTGGETAIGMLINTYSGTDQYRVSNIYIAGDNPQSFASRITEEKELSTSEAIKN